MDIGKGVKSRVGAEQREIDWKANDLEELAYSAQSFLFVGKLRDTRFEISIISRGNLNFRHFCV